MSKLVNRLKAINSRMEFSADTRMSFYRVIQGFCEENLSPYDAIFMLERRHAKAKSSLAYLYNDIGARMRDGATLTDAVGQWVPQREAVFIAVGETSDSLEQSIEEMIQMMETSRELVQTVLASLKNPVTYSVLLFGVVVFISLFMAPRISASIDISQGGAVSVAFFGFCAFVAQFWWLILAVVFTTGALIAISLPLLTGDLRSVVDRVPPWSMYRRFVSAYFLIRLSSMLRSGITLKESIEEIGRYGNRWLRNHTGQMLVHLRRGQSQGEVLDTGMMPPEVADEIIDMGKLSSFNKAIDRIGRSNIEETKKKFVRYGVTLDTLSRFLMFGFILFMLFGVFNVITSIMTSVRM